MPTNLKRIFQYSGLFLATAIVFYFIGTYLIPPYSPQPPKPPSWREYGVPTITPVISVTDQTANLEIAYPVKKRVSHPEVAEFLFWENMKDVLDQLAVRTQPRYKLVMQIILAYVKVNKEKWTK